MDLHSATPLGQSDCHLSSDRRAEVEVGDCVVQYHNFTAALRRVRPSVTEKVGSYNIMQCA